MSNQNADSIYFAIINGLPQSLVLLRNDVCCAFFSRHYKETLATVAIHWTGDFPSLVTHEPLYGYSNPLDSAKTMVQRK